MVTFMSIQWSGLSFSGSKTTTAAVYCYDARRITTAFVVHHGVSTTGQHMDVSATRSQRTTLVYDAERGGAIVCSVQTSRLAAVLGGRDLALYGSRHAEIRLSRIFL